MAARERPASLLRKVTHIRYCELAMKTREVYPHSWHMSPKAHNYYQMAVTAQTEGTAVKPTPQYIYLRVIF